MRTTNKPSRAQVSAAAQELYSSLYLIKSGNFHIAAERILEAGNSVPAPAPEPERGPLTPEEKERQEKHHQWLLESFYETTHSRLEAALSTVPSTRRERALDWLKENLASMPMVVALVVLGFLLIGFIVALSIPAYAAVVWAYTITFMLISLMGMAVGYITSR